MPSGLAKVALVVIDLRPELYVLTASRADLPKKAEHVIKTTAFKTKTTTLHDDTILAIRECASIDFAFSWPLFIHEVWLTANYNRGIYAMHIMLRDLFTQIAWNKKPSLTWYAPELVDSGKRKMKIYINFTFV
jgi:hypothetical protein